MWWQWWLDGANVCDRIWGLGYGDFLECPNAAFHSHGSRKYFPLPSTYGKRALLVTLKTENHYSACENSRHSFPKAEKKKEDFVVAFFLFFVCLFVLLLLYYACENVKSCCCRWVNLKFVDVVCILWRRFSFCICGGFYILFYRCGWHWLTVVWQFVGRYQPKSKSMKIKWKKIGDGVGVGHLWWWHAEIWLSRLFL